MNASKLARKRVAAPLLGAACLASLSLGAATFSGSSQPSAVDSTSPSGRFCKGTANLAYSPQYADKSAADTAYVVIRKVDTLLSTTNVVAQCAAGEGTYAFTPATDADKRVRLLLNAYDATDKAIGETLVSDLAFAIASGASAGVRVDTRAGSLQELAEAGGTAALAYDTAWETNGVPASVQITCVRDRRTRQGQLLGSETNTLFTANAPAVGDFLRTLNPKRGGEFTFRCTFFDALGEPFGDVLTATYGLPYKPGTIIVIR